MSVSEEKGSKTPSRYSKNSFSSTIGGDDGYYQTYFYSCDTDYKLWWNKEYIIELLKNIHDSTCWNIILCISALAAIVSLFMSESHRNEAYFALDITYNVYYAVTTVVAIQQILTNVEANGVLWTHIIGLGLDIISFLHYVVITKHNFKIFCYYLRLHRPLRFLWDFSDYDLKGSIIGTALKYWYIFLVIRVAWASLWFEMIEPHHYGTMFSKVNISDLRDHRRGMSSQVTNDSITQFLYSLYVINKMFVPIGPSVSLETDVQRLVCLMIMMSGCLVLTGAAVASLSSVIGIYMAPEEQFRSRFRLIMKEMKHSNVSASVREKVTTFYRMYWHKQRAVESAQLMPSFPHTLPATILLDIYYEATQKSRILRDLSYEFLSEIVKKMERIHYIPGDSIVKRNSTKSSTIYITYGDIEMLTAEDDISAILRFTKGTMLTPCGGCVAAACGRAHVEMRAATFCTAHVLRAADLWRVVLKHGRSNSDASLMIYSFYEHLDRVKRHYEIRNPEIVKYKSSILYFKRHLMALKEARDDNGNLLLARTDLFLEIAGSYIMRNRTDASLTDEADAICLRPRFPCILQPSSSLQVAWKCFMAVVVLCVTIIYPYYLVFIRECPLDFRILNYLITAIYVLDIVVHLSTGANVEEGVPITLAQTSSQQARSPWFVLDVLATAPIFEFAGDAHFAGINKLLKLPAVFRLLKEFEEEWVYQSNLLRFLSYTLLLLIASYLIGALQHGYMCFNFDLCAIGNFTHMPFWENVGNKTDEVNDRITFSMYWSISMITFSCHKETSVDVHWLNLLTIMINLEICIVLHIFIESVYSATIMVTTAMRERYDASIIEVKNFFIRNQMDPMLRQRFITYLQLCWYTDKGYSMTHRNQTIFHDLPPHVYQDIVAKNRSKYILCIPFMQFLHKEKLKAVSSKATVFYTSPNEILLSTGDMTNELYVIKKGICEIIDPESEEVVNTISVKSHFGVLECLLRFPAFYTVRAVTHVQMLCISRKNLLEFISDVPQIKDAIEFAKEQPEYSRLLVRRPGFLTYAPPAPCQNREFFRLPRKHEHDFEFQNPFSRLGVLAIMRYAFPRFTIRPDGRYLMHYEWFRAACAMTTALIFPGYAYLKLQFHSLIYITLFLDILAYLDMIQRLLIGYYNELGILVYHPAATSAHYLKGPFFIDLFACLPLENLESKYKEVYGNRYLVTHARQLLMLNRVLQLYRIPGVMVTLTGLIERQDILLVIKSTPFFLALLSVFTCLIVLYSVKIYNTVDGNYSAIVPLNDTGGSWINLFEDAFRFNLTKTPWNLHLASLFWVVYETSTTGYNNLNPSNFDIMILLFATTFIGAMVTTYVSVRIISIRANVNTVMASYQEHMRDLTGFMSHENLDPELQKQVQGFFDYNWRKMGGVDCRQVLKLCDQITLRTDATMHLYGPAFAKCPIMSEGDLHLWRAMGRAVHNTYFLRQTHIIKADDVIRDMFFVDQGCVEIDYTEGEECTVYRLARGSVFGNLEDKPTTRYPMSILASTDVHLLQINSVTFHHIIQDFPAVALMMAHYKQKQAFFICGERLEKIVRKINIDRIPQLIKSSRRHIFNLIRFDRPYMNAYLILTCLICVYGNMYNFGFQNNSPLMIVSLYALDVMFYIKILIHYLLPRLVTQDEELKRAQLKEREQYFKNEIKYDIISSLPIELFSIMKMRNWMAFSALRLNRMFRVVTIYNCLERQKQNMSKKLVAMTVFSVFVWFTVFVHTISCIWFFLGLMEEKKSYKSSWLHKDDGSKWCKNDYICSVYFVLTTFTQNGVGDIMPKQQSEVIFVVILMIVSTMVYMVCVGELTNIITYQSYRSFRFFSKYLEMQEFLRNNRVSRNLVQAVNRYSLHLWRQVRGEQLPHLLCSSAPLVIKLDVMNAAYRDHLAQHPVFSGCQPAFLRQVVGCLKVYTYSKGMFVVKANEMTDSMYVIHEGRVSEVKNEEQASTEPPKTYNKGELFGVVHGLVRDLPFSHSFRAEMNSQVLSLRLGDWEYLLDHFPGSRGAVYGHLKSVDEDDADDAADSGTNMGGRRMTRRRKRSSYFIVTPSAPPGPPPPPTFSVSKAALDALEEATTPQLSRDQSLGSAQSLTDDRDKSRELVELENASQRSRTILDRIQDTARRLHLWIGGKINAGEDRSQQRDDERAERSMLQTLERRARNTRSMRDPDDERTMLSDGADVEESTAAKAGTSAEEVEDDIAVAVDTGKKRKRVVLVRVEEEEAARADLRRRPTDELTDKRSVLQLSPRERTLRAMDSDVVLPASSSQQLAPVASDSSVSDKKGTEDGKDDNKES